MMWSDLGNAYRVKGETDLAIASFETARHRPHPDFYLNLGGVRFVLGETEEAVRLLPWDSRSIQARLAAVLARQRASEHGA